MTDKQLRAIDNWMEILSGLKKIKEWKRIVTARIDMLEGAIKQMKEDPILPPLENKHHIETTQIQAHALRMSLTMFDQEVGL